MSKQNARIIFRQASKRAATWDTAIVDAEKMIQEARERIKALKQSIEIFKDLRGKGEPFPGADKQRANDF
jgi:hypothetical protein